MPCREMVMPLAFCASQRLDLSVNRLSERLPEYLQQEERVIASLLDPSQLTRLAPGTYRYTVTSLQVFQLQVKPVVSLEIETEGGTMLMRALDCELQGLGIVDDFNLSLEARLSCASKGLSGDARLEVQVSQPPLLRLIPRRVLETTGESILSGILLGIKTRVGQQLIADFKRWCSETPALTSPQQSAEKAAAMQS